MSLPDLRQQTTYTGFAPDPGLPHRRIFSADEHTAKLAPEWEDNWNIIIDNTWIEERIKVPFKGFK